MSERDQSALDTFLLGLDGACLSVLEPLFDEGRLPTLERVFGRGTVGELESQIPPWTPSAWPSMYTGVNPGRHGVFDFMRFDGYDWDLNDRTHVREWALWELLDKRGLTSVVVNVPMTYPPREFDGALVPGYTAPESPTCHPEGLLTELREELGAYRLYAPESSSDRERTEWYRRLTRMRGEAFRYLTRRFEPEFGFLQFQQTDTVFHEQPENGEAIREVFTAVERELEQIVAEFDPNTIIVASDHGIGRYDGYEFRVNDYLADCGYVAKKRGGEGMPSWSTISRKTARRGQAGGSRDRTLLERSLELSASVGLTSQRMKRVLDRVGLTSTVLSILPMDAVRAASEQVDFEASAAYMRSRTELGVHLNLAGREPSGTISPAEYERVRADVMAELRAARTPDGEPVFESVSPREEWFDGPYVDEVADIIIVPSNFDHYLRSSLRGDVFERLEGTWNHKRDGVVALAGDGVNAEADIEDAHLFDIAPTVLATLGVPPTTKMEGTALSCVETTASERYPPFSRIEGHRPDRDGQALRRLSDLGYIE